MDRKPLAGLTRAQRDLVIVALVKKVESVDVGDSCGTARPPKHAETGSR